MRRERRTGQPPMMRSDPRNKRLGEPLDGALIQNQSADRTEWLHEHAGRPN